MADNGPSIHPGRMLNISSSGNPLPRQTTGPDSGYAHLGDVSGRFHLIQDSIDQFVKQQYKRLVDTFVDDFIVQVSNVHPNAGENDLRQLFKELGSILSITPVLYPNRRPKGIWFIQFETIQDAQKAVTYTNQLVQGHPINVSPNASPRTAEKALELAKEQAKTQFSCLTCVGLPFETEQDKEFTTFFQTFGSIEHVEIVRYTVDECIVYIKYRSPDAVKQAIDTINDNNFIISGKSLHVYPGTYKPPVLQHRYDQFPLVAFQVTNEELCISYKDITTTLTLPSHPKYVPIQFRQPQISAARDAPASRGQQPKTTSRGIIVSNVFDPKQQLTQQEAENILLNVAYECSKYCRVLHNSLHPNGNLYLLVDSVHSADTILTRLHGRWMNYRKLTCLPILESSLHAIHPTWFES